MYLTSAVLAALVLLLVPGCLSWPRARSPGLAGRSVAR